MSIDTALAAYASRAAARQHESDVRWDLIMSRPLVRIVIREPPAVTPFDAGLRARELESRALWARINDRLTTTTEEAHGVSEG